MRRLTRLGPAALAQHEFAPPAAGYCFSKLALSWALSSKPHGASRASASLSGTLAGLRVAFATSFRNTPTECLDFSLMRWPSRFASDCCVSEYYRSERARDSGMAWFSAVRRACGVWICARVWNCTRAVATRAGSSPTGYFRNTRVRAWVRRGSRRKDECGRSRSRGTSAL